MIKETAGAKYIRELLGGDLSLFANPNDMVRAVYKKIAPKDKKSPSQNRSALREKNSRRTKENAKGAGF